ncbi:MAG: hypothetical protein HKL95_09210 [Phycisphaerae bacterium]|nr:hypothetical protein [Phycisphaerae bacterium]
MPMVPPQALAAVLIVTGFVGCAWPHARATGDAAKLVGHTPPISIIMLAKPQPPAPDAAKISAWIHDLALGNAADQTRARQLLVVTGDDAVPALKKALDKPRTAKSHQRLRAALDAIYTADALRGPLVSVRAKNASLKSVIGVLCDEAGMYPYFPPHPTWSAQHMNINIQQQPFWTVLLRIAKATGVGPTNAQYGPSAGFFFDRHGLFTPGSVVAIHGDFAMVIRSARQISVYGSQQTSGQGHRELVVKYCGLHVPTPHVLFQTSPLMVRLAVDDQHRILAAPASIRSSPYSTTIINSPVFGFPWQAILGRPSTKAKFITLLQTRLRVTAATDPQVIRCGDLAKGKGSMHFDGMTIKFGQPTLAGTTWKEVMKISLPTRTDKSRRMAAVMARLTNTFPSPFHFRSSHGQLLVSTGGGGYGNPKHYQGTFYFSNDKPATVELKIYRHATVITLPFKFQHIPLER